MKKYSVADLDELRQAVLNKSYFGFYIGQANPDWTFTGHGLNGANLEERIRTHMLAGHTAKDLIDSERSGLK
jgi:hypothetical protein